MKHLTVPGVALASLAFAASFGCTNASQDLIEVDLEVAGTEVTAHELDGMTVTLSRADVAFGPLYLCPGRQAGENCDTARLEWTESAVVDALDKDLTKAGVMNGVTGPIRSWMFDYGITSLLTQKDPVAFEAAEQLGDASVVLEGEATIEGTVIPFEISAIVAQGPETETGVQVIRKSTSETFEFEVTESSEAFEVRFDPTGWISALEPTDFETAVGDCEIGTDEACDAVVWESESDVARGVALELEAGARPSFNLR